MKEIQILNNGDTLNAIRTKINENFELMEKGTSDPLAKFGVNEGNETDGVADLLNIEEGTLSFKVGGEYPNLVTTSGDGVTTQIESINPLHLQNLADGEYTVVVDDSNSNITDAEFYSQLLEPENANNGDVWFNGESALQAKQSLSSVTKLEVNNNTNFRKIVNIGNKYVAVGDSGTVSKSDDGGVTWSTLQLNSFQTGGVPIGCEVFDDKFYIVGSDKTTQFIDQNWQVSQGGNIAATSTSLRFLKNVNGKLLIGTSDGYVLMSDNTTSWGQMNISLSIGIMDIVFADGLYYAFNAQGNIFTSANLSTWTKLDVTTAAVHTAAVQGNRIIGAGNSGRLSIYSVPEKTVTLVNTPTTEIIRDIKLLEDGTFILVGDKGVCLTGKDINNLTKLNTGTSAALNCTHNGFVAGASGTFFKLGADNQWIPYPYIPVGEVTISGGEVTYFTTYPYNTNGLHEASSSSFGLLRTAAVVDELNCHCSDAVLTPANLYSLNNYRTMNTEYQVGDKVGCPYHHNLQLNCIQWGTTSNEALNTREILGSGTVIEDGSVIWKVEELGSGGGTGLNDKITNCITELPQRIKLELNNGTLTLKAGSEVIVPNGFESDGTTPKFDYVKLPNDAVLQKGAFTSASASRFIGIIADTFGFWATVSTYTNSGNTQTMNSTSAYTYSTFYNTETNKMYKGDGTAWLESNISLPIALIENSTSEIISINQTFNGIGCIGSTLWVDKDVKGLIPNGRNEDGSLNNYVAKTDKLRLGVNIGTSSAYPYWFVWSNLSKDNLPVGFRNGAASTTYFQNEKPALNYGVNYAVWYCPSENLVRFTNNAGLTWEKSNYCMIASYTCDNGIVTKFNPKTTFKALDYNDKSEVSTWAFPSNKYIDLTLGASGSTYIAPANGWVLFRRTSTAAGQFLQLVNENCGKLQHFIHSSATSQTLGVSVPVKKGDLVVVGYSVASTTNQIFRFIYAQGEV